MKLLAYILACLIAFLAVKPGVDALFVPSETPAICCSASKCAPFAESPQDGEKPDEHHEKEVCNPFLSCCSFVPISIGQPFYATPKVLISTEQIADYHSSLFSQFISDFWNPPKFV